MKNAHAIGSNAALIALFTIVTKISGFVRDRIFAHELGVTRTADIYYAAFKIPDFIFNIVVLGALSSAFIPSFIRAWREGRGEAFSLANSVITVLTLVMAAVAILAAFVMPSLVTLIVPGFPPDDHALVVMLSRLMLLSVLFFSVSNVMGGMLNGLNRFIAFSISPIVYNIGIIVGLLIWYPSFGVNGLAAGVVVGAFMHALIQAIALYRLGWRFSFRFAIDEHIRKMFTLMVPRIISLVSSQINIVITTGIISFLAAGSLSVYTYAFNIQSLPVSVIGVSFALAAFPAFSYSLGEGNTGTLRDLLAKQVRRVVFLLLPISAFLLLVRAHIVRVILGSGAFDWTATYLTAQTLGYFSTSLISQGLIPLFSRVFFAAENTKTPTIVSLFSIAVNVVLSVFLARRFGIVGVAAAFSISNTLHCILLYAILAKKYDLLSDSAGMQKNIMGMLVATLASSGVTYAFLRATSTILNTHTFIGIFTQGAIAVVFGALSYILLSQILKIPELRDITNKMKSITHSIFSALRP